MMAKRMIDSGMWSNENYAALPAMARLLLVGIITLADDQGRCKANPAYLRSQIFPYEDISTDDIDRWLSRMADNETIILYDANGKAYLQLTNWWGYQPLDWAHPSDYPAPDGWKDRLRFNAKGNVCLTYNWRTKSGNSPADNCDSRGVPTQVGTQVPTIVPTQVGTQVTKLNLTKPNLNGADAPTADSSSSDWADVVKVYEHEIGLHTETIAEQMGAAYDEVGATMLIDAIKEAARSNVRKWSYVAGILAKWKVNGRTGPKDSGDSWTQLNSNLPDYMKEG